MKSEDKLKERVVKGAIWKLAEKFGMNLMQIVIQIVLARLLLPEDYGIIGLLAIFISISDVFLLQGFTTALIQKKDADEVDFSSVFFANIIMSLVIYAVLFAIAPLVSDFYNLPQLNAIMRVLSLNIIIGAFCAVHNAIISRNLEFKLSFVRNVANTATQGIVGIFMACNGFGVWSLVISKIAGTFVGMLLLCVTVNWKPKMLFSAGRISSLFSYSSRILGTNLLNTIFNNIHSMVIGKFFLPADVGFYQRGQQIPQVAMTAIDGSLNEVLYPTLSILQNDLSKLKDALRRSMKTSMYIVLPMITGLLVTAEPLTILLLTDKWLASVPFMQLTCAITLFWPFSARLHALNALGLSDVTFKLSLITKLLIVIMIIICIPMGIYAIMWGTLLASVISFFITSHYVNKYIGYSLKELGLDIAYPVALTIAMACIVLIIGNCIDNLMLKLVVQTMFGIAFYFGCSEMLKIEQYIYVKNLFIKLLHR